MENKMEIIDLLPEMAPDDVDIVCICGSTSFSDQHAIARWELEKTGKHIALSIHYLPEWFVERKGWESRDHYGESAGYAKELDELHKRKIDISDWILVINVDDYIGESTADEIEYGKNQGKPIKYLYPHKE